MTTSSDFHVSRLEEPAQQLRTRFAEDGYLFLKGAVAAADCDALREDILAALYPHVVWDPLRCKPKLHGRPFYETDEVWDQVYPRIQKLERFHRFFHTPAMLDIMERVQGCKPWVYPIKMARVATPRMLGYETPPHQDAYSHHAGPTMAGIWVALHDVDASMGRVTVLPGSHKGGVRKVLKAQGVGGIQCEIHAHETHWHVSDFENGDVLVFNSATVHRAEPNTAEDKVRISVDTRFCDYGAPVFSTNLEPHHGWRIDGLDWDNIYADWVNRDGQYYWKSYPNTY